MSHVARDPTADSAVICRVQKILHLCFGILDHLLYLDPGVPCIENIEGQIAAVDALLPAPTPHTPEHEEEEKECPTEASEKHAANGGRGVAQTYVECAGRLYSAASLCEILVTSRELPCEQHFAGVLFLLLCTAAQDLDSHAAAP